MSQKKIRVSENRKLIQYTCHNTSNSQKNECNFDYAQEKCNTTICIHKDKIRMTIVFFEIFIFQSKLSEIKRQFKIDDRTTKKFQEMLNYNLSLLAEVENLSSRPTSKSDSSVLDTLEDIKKSILDEIKVEVLKPSKRGGKKTAYSTLELLKKLNQTKPPFSETFIQRIEFLLTNNLNYCGNLKNEIDFTILRNVQYIRNLVGLTNSSDILRFAKKRLACGDLNFEDIANLTLAYVDNYNKLASSMGGFNLYGNTISKRK